jgi:hypothetical protein
MGVFASGIGATLGVAAESSYATYAAPTRWLEFDSESLAAKKTAAISKALHGDLYAQSSRRVVTSWTADGKIEMDLVDRQLGLLFEMMLGSTPTITEQGTSGAYLQVHTPGGLRGKSLSIQKGVPTVEGTIEAFTYLGAKVTEWEISAEVDQIAKFMLTFDAQQEVTTETYVAPSYVLPNPLTFAGGSLTLGGTTLATVRSVNVKSTNPMDEKRFYLGSLYKAEPIDNNFREPGGEVELDFANMTDTYTAFAADSDLALTLTFTGPVIATGYNSYVEIQMPAVVVTESSPVVGGPEIVSVKAPFSAYDNGSAPVITLSYQSLDSAV